jgi:hypothetical protein
VRILVVVDISKCARHPVLSYFFVEFLPLDPIFCVLIHLVVKKNKKKKKQKKQKKKYQIKLSIFLITTTPINVDTFSIDITTSHDVESLRDLASSELGILSNIDCSCERDSFSLSSSSSSISNFCLKLSSVSSTHRIGKRGMEKIMHFFWY